MCVHIQDIYIYIYIYIYIHTYIHTCTYTHTHTSEVTTAGCRAEFSAYSCPGRPHPRPLSPRYWVVFGREADMGGEWSGLCGMLYRSSRSLCLELVNLARFCLLPVSGPSERCGRSRSIPLSLALSLTPTCYRKVGGFSD